MGVNSLWKALDEAGCGKPVGIQEITNPNRPSKRSSTLHGVNPWNVHRHARAKKQEPKKKVFLAVDLSIWICESLSSVIAENHAQPAIHLVFTRTVKLLSLGIGLVFVIEGKRRIRDAGITSNDQADKFRKRRNGTAFWKACKNCHDMLKLMGVPVVRAKAEGEALSALLNQRGVVDGVISNDGDCLLFGAKVVYTKFSIDNLENNRVMRYEADQLSAVIQASDAKDVTTTEIGRLNLSRQDLIAFALLTGSDLAGNGLDNVGYKKAIRFIRKCQLDNPLRVETASIDELKAWASSVAPCDIDPFDQPVLGPIVPGPTCSRCNHPGSKNDHLKHGCKTCGTAPGEACFECTPEDRFRLSLRAKALALFPKFDPSQVVEAYTRPNENVLPVSFSANTTPSMKKPDLLALMKMKLVVKGRSQEGSRDYIKTSVGRLLSRAELLEPERGGATEQNQDKENRPVKAKNGTPVPLEITKAATVGGTPSYHVFWSMGASSAGGDGKASGGYEYTTVEPQDLVQKRFPALVEKFLVAEKERTKQGDGEKNRRRAFLASLWNKDEDTFGKDDEYGDDDEEEEGPDPSPRKKRDRKRKNFFKDSKHPGQRPAHRKKSGHDGGDDVHKLLRFVHGPQPFEGAGDSSIESSASELSQKDDDSCQTSPGKRQEQVAPDEPLSPLYCHFGSFLIPITPIEAMVPGEFPPQRIYVRRNHSSAR